MRPKSIIFFELLYLMSLGLGLVQVFLDWGNSLNVVNYIFAVITPIFVLLVLTVLIFLVSRRRNIIGKWIIVTTTLFGLPVFIQVIVSEKLIGFVWISVVQAVLQLVAIVLIFLPTSNRWLKKQGPYADLEDTFS